MNRYDPDELVTFYFVIMSSDGIYGEDRIQAWSDRKDLVKAYMQFHKCPHYRLKKITKPMHQMVEILDENNHDEINMYNITTRDPKHPKRTKRIVIPATVTEQLFINEEIANFMMTQIDYAFLANAVPYLKPKYQRALEQVLLMDIIRKNVHGQNPVSLQKVEMDQLLVLVRSFPEHFGV